MMRPSNSTIHRKLVAFGSDRSLVASWRRFNSDSRVAGSNGMRRRETGSSRMAIHTSTCSGRAGTRRISRVVMARHCTSPSRPAACLAGPRCTKREHTSASRPQAKHAKGGKIRMTKTKLLLAGLLTGAVALGTACKTDKGTTNTGAAQTTTMTPDAGTGGAGMDSPSQDVYPLPQEGTREMEPRSEEHTS